MQQTSRAVRGRLAAVVLALLLAAACYTPRFAATAAADAPTVLLFDGPGAALASDERQTASESLIQNFAASGQIVRWPANIRPVPFCTIEANRPATVTTAQFHDAVRLAAEMWDNVDAAIGIRYIGTCASTQMSLDNDVNEIAWDDVRNIVSGPASGITQGQYRAGAPPFDFVEADIVLDNNMRLPEACLRTVLAHEMGHALGFGHSDSRGDLMWPSFNPNDLTTCRPTASASEIAWLIDLYGGNQKPRLTKPADRSVQAGAAVVLSAEAVDPEGDAVTFEWKQIAGPAITLTPVGGSTSFTAPASGPVTVEVAAFDRFLHRATATVTLSVTQPGGFPSPLAVSGITIAQWGGGNVTAAAATPGARVRSIWVLQGVATGYVAGAPDFVNQPFLALFPAGAIPAGTPLVVVTGG